MNINSTIILNQASKLKFWVILISFLGFTSNTIAQDTLSLSYAIELALENNFQIQISSLRQQQAQRNNTIGQAGGLPTVAFSLSERNTLKTNNSPTSFIQGSYFYGSLAPTIDVGWVLFNGFAVKMTKEKLANLQYQSEGNAQLIVENTIQSVIIAYYKCLLEKEKLEVFQKLNNDSKTKFEYVSNKKALGLLTTFDVLQEQNNFLTDSANYMMQDLNYANAIRNLNVVLGQSVETSLNLTDQLNFVAKAFDLTTLKTQLESNTSLKTEMLNIQLRKSDLGISKAQLYPSFKVNIGSNYSLDGAVFDGELQTGDSYDFYLNFSINWTLFNGGKIKNGIANAQDDIRIAELQVDEVKLSLNNQLLSNVQLYETRKKVLALNQERLKTAQLSLDLAQDRYKSGLLNSIDYRVVQNNYLNAKLTTVTSIYQLIDTETEILRLTGGIIRK